MKLLHVFMTLELALGLTSDLYSASEVTRQLPSLCSLARDYIIQQIETIVKNGIHAKAPISAIIEAIHPWLKNLTGDAINMIRVELLKDYANKTFKVLGYEVVTRVQLFDGRIINRTHEVSPRESDNDPYQLMSNWSNLSIDEIIEKYYTVHQAWKLRGLHPFFPINRNPDLPADYDEDEQEPFVLSRPIAR